MEHFIYSPHFNFYIDKARRGEGYSMSAFHTHKKYEIYYQMSGIRQYFIDDSLYTVNPGDLVIIGSNEIHKTQSLENTSHGRYVINFDVEFIKSFLECSRLEHLLDLFNKKDHLVTVPPRFQNLIEGFFEQLWNGKDLKSDEDFVLRKMKIIEILIYVSRFKQDKKNNISRAGTAQTSLIDKIQKYIIINYSESLTLGGIAEKFYISAHYLSYLFKKTSQMGVSEYINKIRIMAAKDLLETSNNKILFIAAKSGFSTSGHFTRVFKERFGMSPMQYRKLYRETNKLT